MTPRRRPSQRKRLIHSGLTLHFLLQLSLAEDADRGLAQRGMGRIHHRILFIAHLSPGITVTELLSILNVRHQNIQGVLRELTREGFVAARKSTDDRRAKRLYPTRKGETFLELASAAQFERVGRGYAQATARDVAGYLKVMSAMLDSERRRWAERLTALTVK